MYLMAKLGYLRRPILKFIKTKECANYRKIALTLPWLEGIMNTWKETLGILKKTLGICPPKKPSYATDAKRSQAYIIQF